MKLFIKSCHASLEYDQARMFKDLGHEVFGQFDVGSRQRPKLPGITDVQSDIKDFDTIILHQVEDFDLVMESLLAAGKRVILIAFGQGCARQHINVGALCARYSTGYVVAYSVKDFNIYKAAGCPRNRVKLIRFGKYLDDYGPWRDRLPICYLSCNAIQRRGDGCGWPILQSLIDTRLPILFSGNETDTTPFGIGELNDQGVRNMWNNVRCHLSLGTTPAPIVLTLIEAFASGTPVVAYDNGHGIAGEGFDLVLETSVIGLGTQIMKTLYDDAYRHELHLKSLNNAKLFDVKVIGQQWQQLLGELNENIC